jgi:ketosteroid isomerase-like protein
MTADDTPRPSAHEPEELGRLFLARANAGDAAGLTALYEPDAILALPGGGQAVGTAAIRAFYEKLLATHPTFTSGRPRIPICHGDWALTSTGMPAGATTEVAHRQEDGSWLWVIDQPDVLGAPETR